MPAKCPGNANGLTILNGLTTGDENNTIQAEGFTVF